MNNNQRFILGHNDKKEEIDNFQVHEVVKKIIFEIDRICRKNDIPYALAFGSALGLYNFNGIIPWDDDGDIVISYFDYERFVNACQKDLSDDYTLDCEMVNKRYNPLIPAIKIRYKHSSIKEKNRFTLPDHTKERGIFVDICFFMGVPSNIKEHRKLIKKSKLLMPLYIFLDAFLHLNPKRIRSSLRKHERMVAEKYRDSDYVSQTVIIPFQEHPKYMVHSLAFPKEVIYPFKEYDFYGKKIYSFNNIKEFCLLRYGDSSLHIKENLLKEGVSDKYSKNGHSKVINIYK